MKVKAKFENIRDKIDGNEVDLSLCNLTDVPVRELVSEYYCILGKRAIR